MNATNRWLSERADTISTAVIRSAPNALLYEEDVVAFLSTVLEATEKPTADQLHVVQKWTHETIGQDSFTAGDWLLVVRLLKEKCFQHLLTADEMSTMVSDWPAVDKVITYAIVEISKIVSNVDNAMLLEHMMELREKMEELDRNKTRFIQVAAHELRTPLTLMEGYANMIRTTVDEDDTLVNMYLGGLDGGTARLREIIRDMIDVSLIDSGSFEISYQEFHLPKVMERVVSSVRRTFQDRKVDLHLQSMPTLDPLYGDSERLMQALEKVISNGMKYTPDGGSVTIEAKVIKHEDDNKENTHPSHIDISVTDTGIGIDPKDLERIFNTFGGLGKVSLHSTGKTKFKGGGPGLGLPIAKGIVEAHGGNIWADSDGYNERTYPGSVFHIELPVRHKMPPEAKEGDEPQDEEATAAPVEDNPINPNPAAD